MCVADGDLGRFKFKKKTWQITSALSLFINNPRIMKNKIISKPEFIKKIRAEGKIISDYTDVIVRRTLQDLAYTKIKIGKYIVEAYNNPEFLRTQIAREIYAKTKKPVAIFNINGEHVRVHFRSENSIHPSALELAQTIGGNGHRNAAAASVSLKKFLAMIIAS